MRYIWIVRHGKSALGEPGQPDHDRPLNPRGERDGANMCTWFGAEQRAPQWIWTSTATRAMSTARFVADGAGAILTEVPELYLASPEAILDCLRATPDDVTSVALVAHNPGLTYTVNQLGSNGVTENLVTFGTALFATEDAWPDLQFGRNHFISLTEPRTLVE